MATPYWLRNRTAWTADAGRDTGVRWRASQLTVDIRAPTPCTPVGTDAAGMRAARGEPHECLCPSHGVGNTRPEFERIAELAKLIVSPTIRRSRRGQAATMQGTYSDHREFDAAAHRSRSSCVGNRIPQLTVIVQSPAERRAIRRQSAGVKAPGAHRQKPEPTEH